MPKFCCKYCKKEFNSKGQMRTLFAHIKSEHNLSKKELYDREFKLDYDGLCKACGNQTEFSDWMFKYRDYCNRSCQMKGINPVSYQVDWSYSRKRKEADATFTKEGSFTCKVCGKSDIHYYNLHIKSHNITPKEYYDKYLKQEVEGICRNCGDDTPFVEKGHYYQSYCSPSCRAKCLSKLHKVSKSLYASIKNGDVNSRFGTRKGYYGEYKNSGIYMRSSWERQFADLLDINKVEWLYEPKTFNLIDCRYTPDFYLPKFDKWIEIKPQYFAESVEEKGNKMELLYNIDLVLLDLSEFVNFVNELVESAPYVGDSISKQGEDLFTDHLGHPVKSEGLSGIGDDKRSSKTTQSRDNQKPSFLRNEKEGSETRESSLSNNLYDEISTSALGLSKKDHDMVRAMRKLIEDSGKLATGNNTGIPIYFTPTLTTDELKGRKAALSMYDIVVNQRNYFVKGNVKNVT
jgi:hypothetical protein